jgi:HSP20 family protein
MAYELWEPFREAVSLRDAMNSLLQESFVRPAGGHGHSAAVALPLDVAENENEFVVKASLPGFKPENVQITIQGDALSIRAEAKTEEEQKGDRWHLRERRSGSFQRSLALGTPVDSEKAHADFEHGVLTLTLPKAEASKPRQIKIGGQGGSRTVQENGAKKAASAQ